MDFIIFEAIARSEEGRLFPICCLNEIRGWVWSKASKTKTFTNAEMWQLYKREITKPLHQFLLDGSENILLFKNKTVCTISISGDANRCTFASEGFSTYYFFFSLLNFLEDTFLLLRFPLLLISWSCHISPGNYCFSVCLSLWMQVLVLSIL